MSTGESTSGRAASVVPEVMLAVRVTRHGGPEVLEVTEVPVPSPRRDEVLVEVTAAALNNTDLWTREGAYGLPGQPDALAGWRGPVDLPRIPGADVAGRVVATGPGVAEAVLGRRVVVDPAVYDGVGADANPVGVMGSERDGGYAHFVTAPVERVHDVSGSPLTDDQLAALPVAYGTALGMVERGRVTDGETVLVTGASGGVGIALVQLARDRGARVLAVTSSAKTVAVRRAGAHEVLDRGGDVLEQVQACAPGGVDVVLDVVAGDLLSTGLPLLRESGRWVVAGALAGHDVSFDVRRLYLRNAQLIGSSMHTPAHFDRLMDIARRARVAPLIAATFPLTDAARAQAALARRSHVGKLVLHPHHPHT